MENFKVISKSATRSWVKVEPMQALKTTSSFFGLIKKTKLISENERVPGPAKDEVCLVTEVITSPYGTCYILAGYPFGPYLSKYFIRLDEMEETLKEIAIKAKLHTYDN